MPPQLTFRSFFFTTGLGYAIYYMLRNDWMWSLLSEEEKAFVKEQNTYWNNNNPGYINPEEYQGQKGQSFITLSNRLSTWEGKVLNRFLSTEMPNGILEVGPGSGYYTRMLIDCVSVNYYVATDINIRFLSAVNEAIKAHPKAANLKMQMIAINDLDASDVKVDAIIILSALHHIPDRAEFVKKLTERLSPTGKLFFYEPTHTLARIVELFISFIRHGWFLRSVVTKRNNYMTHHFCTISETKKIAESSGLEIIDWGWNTPWKIPKLDFLSKIFAREMFVVLAKKS